MSIRRVLIAGSKTFNNYFIMRHYLKRDLLKDVIICNGGANGADMIAAVYAERNGHIYEPYPADWERYGANAGKRRNQLLAQVVDSAYFFWDGSSPSTKELIELVKAKGIDPIIIDITDDDIIHPHPERVVNIQRDAYDEYIGKGHGAKFGNPFPAKEACDIEWSIAMFCDYLINTPSLLNMVADLKDKKLGCTCPPHICHGDALVWLLDHEELLNTFVDRANNKPTKVEEERQRYLADIQAKISRWPIDGADIPVYTEAGTCIAERYNRVIQIRNMYLLEIEDTDMVKSNLWITLAEQRRQDNEEDSVRDIRYRPMDKTTTDVIYIKSNYPSAQMREGYWYVLATSVTPVKI